MVCRPSRTLAGLALMAAIGVGALLVSRPASAPLPTLSGVDHGVTEAGSSSADVIAIERAPLPVATVESRRPAQLTGMVRDEDGRPIPGAEIRLRVEDGTDSLLIELPDPTCDEGGAFHARLEPLRTLSPVLWGDAYLCFEVRAPGYQPVDDYRWLAECKTAWIHVEIALDPMPSDRWRVGGRVVDAFGQPVPEAEVRLDVWPDVRLDVWPDGEKVDSAESDAGGYYELIVAADDLAATPAVRARHPAHGHSAPLPVIGRRPDFELPDLVLGRGAAVIRGHVQFPDGTPVVGTAVDVSLPDGASQQSDDVFSVVTDSRGCFEAMSPVPGRYDIWSPGMEDEKNICTGEPPVSLTVRQCRLTVAIEDRDGVPLRGAEFRLLTWSGAAADRAQRAWHGGSPLSVEVLAEADQAMCGLDGVECREWVEPGSFCVVECSHNGAGPVLASCRFGPGRFEIRLDLRLEREPGGSGLRFALTDPEGRAAARIAYRARLVRTGGPWIDGVGARLDGCWRLIDAAAVLPLPVGEYWIEAIGDPVVLSELPYRRGRLPVARSFATLRRTCRVGGPGSTDVVHRAPRQAQLELILCPDPGGGGVRFGGGCQPAPPLRAELCAGAHGFEMPLWHRGEDGPQVLCGDALSLGENVRCAGGDHVPAGRWLLRVMSGRTVVGVAQVALRPGRNQVEVPLTGETVLTAPR